jgi:hypothetical protein
LGPPGCEQKIFIVSGIDPEMKEIWPHFLSLLPPDCHMDVMAGTEVAILNPKKKPHFSEKRTIR